MIKSLWFFAQIAALIAGGIWLSKLEGDMAIDIANYSLSMQTGVFFIALAFIFILSLFIYRFVRGIFNIPKTIGDMRGRSRQAKGYKALTRGLSALAAGDQKKALSYAKQTRQFLPKEKGLPLFLEASAARLNGDIDKANGYFEQLIHDKDAGFLGMRGLLNNALSQQDYESALDHTRQSLEAISTKKKPAWLLQTLYELELKNQQWSAAQTTLKLLARDKIISDEKIKSDQVAFHHITYHAHLKSDNARAAIKEIEKAYKLDNGFVPSALILIHDALSHNKRAKAVKLFKKIWQQNPHPDLAQIWSDMAPVIDATKSEKAQSKMAHKRESWFNDLLALNGETNLGYIACAKEAMHQSNWGEAKSYLLLAEKIEPSKEIYRLMAVIAENLDSEESADSAYDITNLMERAASAPSTKVWLCGLTGIIYERWEPIAEPHSSFNTIIWDYPHKRIANDSALGLYSPQSMHDDANLLLQSA